MKNTLAKLRELPPLQKAALWLGIAVLVYTLIGFLVAPLILKAVLEKKLPQALNRPVTIETVRLNPFALSLTIEGFALAEKDGPDPFVFFDRLYVNLESFSLFKKGLILQSISLKGPAIHVRRLDEKTFSFSDLLAGPAGEEPAEEKSGPFLFSINNIEIENGSIRYEDLPKGASHTIDAFTLAIPSISNLPSRVQASVQPHFSAVINGTPISLAGGSKPFAETRATEVDLKMSGINIPEYLAYIPNPTGLTVKSALLDIDTRLSYLLMPDEAARLALTGTLTLRAVEVIDGKGESYLRFPSLTVVLADSDLLKKEIRLAELTLDSPQLDLTRLPDGSILPLALLSPSDGGAPEAPADREEAPSPSDDPVSVTIDRFRLDNGAVTWTDQALENPARVRLDAIALTAAPLSTVPGTENAVTGSLRLNQTGSLKTDGILVLDPLALNTSVTVEGVQLKDFQPYLSEEARIVLAGGTLGLQGDLAVKEDAAGQPGLHFAGQSSVAGLATTDTLSGEDLVKWKDLQVREIAFSSSPFELTIAEIRLENPYVKVLINDDGTVNISHIARTDGRKDAPSTAPLGKETPPGAEAKIAIQKVTLRNGKVLFLDRSIKPAYGANLDQLNGAITGLSSRAGTLATVKVDARIDKQAPLAISGEVNPLSEVPFADIKIDFKDFNLSPLSPYTGKYVGYKTDKGKLNLDLRYQLKGNRLESSNNVFLDQFTLGEGVESPDATSLPVSLALALLKNRQGEISLDIPVTGDLNDPEFSVGGVVIQVLVNLVTKAATSPFALLGSLIPEGEDLQHIPFEPGRAQLTAETTGKLSAVANVLHERPGLRMDISGGAASVLDRRALARIRMDKLVKLEKLKGTGGKKGEDVDLQGIEVNVEEYPRYLKQAYSKALKAAEDEGRKEPLPGSPENEGEAVSRMEAFLLQGIKIEEEELRLLALDRANTVLGYLIEPGKVEPGRLFVIEPHLARPEEEGAQESQTQVELLLK
ncbi:hypothetical protein DSOUD_0444 [Desulfuromonas soudanensis]|uniref:DUF748 domain-containing protein n=1 Tax=Desulfuromonas soudanensis TaxID=1603606 RepID=A0A0M4D089_9BACT|nr:DUF748 domain-containing protein [Desulfuromonas soudanensis]ALC15238.1 hypothetical protein DSOUD_0444 [Desulfuromonas soudanensis]